MVLSPEDRAVNRAVVNRRYYQSKTSTLEGAEQYKEYRRQNKLTYTAIGKIACACGSNIHYTSKSKHVKSIKHTTWVVNNTEKN